MPFTRKDAERARDAEQLEGALAAPEDGASEIADDAAWAAWAAGASAEVADEPEEEPERRRKLSPRRFFNRRATAPEADARKRVRQDSAGAEGDEPDAPEADAPEAPPLEEPAATAAAAEGAEAVEAETSVASAAATRSAAVRRRRSAPVAAADSDEAASQPVPLDPTRRQERQERLEQVERSRKKRRRRKVARRVMWALLGLFVAAIIASLGAFAANRWYSFDDAADMVGTWRLEGTDMQVEITEDTIRLTDEVAYRYTIDPSDKTITFKFGNMTGQGRYRFSLDRQELSITDGSFDFWGTLLSDLPWTLAALCSEWFGGGVLTPGVGEGVTALTRELTAQPDEPAADGSSGALDVPPGAGAGDGAQDAAGEGADGAADGADAGADADAAAGDAPASDDAGAASSAASSAADAAGSDVRDVDALDLPADA